MKPENILLKEENKSGIKIIDFGLCESIESKDKEYAGSPWYMAPEVLRHIPSVTDDDFKKGDYGRECDIWSLGVILYFMLKKEVPFEAYQHNQIYKKVKKGQYDREDISDNALELLNKML